MKKGHATRHRKLAARQRAADQGARAPQVDQSRREAFARERVRRWGGPFRPPALIGGTYAFTLRG